MTLAGRAALALFTLALAASAWALGDGAAGWLYLLCYALAALPGLPLGFALFGRGHAGGWIAGVLLGYALTAIAIWAPIAAHVPSAPAFLIAWAAMTALMWFVKVRLPAFALRASARSRRSSGANRRSGGGKPDTTGIPGGTRAPAR